ncbi:hypothetical protein FRC11_008327, partial [Ceratobasidium sp. 423]
ERSFTKEQWHSPAKRNSSVKKRQISLCEKSVKKPPGREVPIPAAASKSSSNSEEPHARVSSSETLPEYLRGAKQDDIEVWWRVLGFTNQRGPIKRDKFIKALRAVGFKPRNRDGAKATFNPPTNFSGSGTRALALHLRKQ